jgi:hypothetical protein
MILASGPCVGHPEDPHRTALHQAAGKGRLIQQHQRIQRIAVLGQGVRHESVVGGIDGGGEQATIEAHHLSMVVELVFVAASPRYLNDDLDRPVIGHLAHLSSPFSLLSF